MRNLFLAIVLSLASLSSFAVTTDSQNLDDQCVDQLKAKITKLAQRRCIGLKCRIPWYTVNLYQYTAEQNSGYANYAVSGCKVYGQKAQCHSVYFKAVTFRSSDRIEGETVKCKVKRLRRISESEFNKLAAE